MEPNGWKLTTFENHIDLLSGFAFKSAQYTETADDIRLLRGDNIAPNTLRWEGVKRWDKSEYSELKKYHLREHDFVIAMDRTWVSSGLKVAEVTKEDLPCLLVQRVSRIRALDTLEQSLLKQYFSSHRFEQYVKGVQTETAVPHISSKQIKEFSLLLPPLPEQQKIAKILSTWDKVIATTERLIATSQQQKKALMQQLLTGKKRLVNPETGLVFEGDWEEVQLQNVLEKIIDYRGQSVPKASSGIPLITARNVRMGYLDFTAQEYIDESLFDNWMTRGTPKNGDVLFTTEAPLGMACRYPKEGIYGVGQRTVTLRVNSKLHSDFLLYYLLSDRGQLLIDLRSSGSTAKGIKSSELKKVKITYPKGILEQQKIASVLTAADKEIELLQAKLAHLKDEKKALMRQLLTGKRRVKVDAMEMA
ncbi:restriction endonuclease subunit S [Vibrio spartinae]|uniref:Type I restriction enzyme EcoKI specificity protein n=1 Tax=Vibrio spartinae TaxID=1918945 RepID=A0ABX6R392_9VIBR|nr:restriction endonuclease subunit S [Vibrio spartinae]QMV16009.1 Type I restriction enzyme EcoKI specificity protein [Vibrio spartinae]